MSTHTYLSPLTISLCWFEMKTNLWCNLTKLCLSQYYYMYIQNCKQCLLFGAGLISKWKKKGTDMKFIYRENVVLLQNKDFIWLYTVLYLWHLGKKKESERKEAIISLFSLIITLCSPKRLTLSFCLINVFIFLGSFHYVWVGMEDVKRHKWPLMVSCLPWHMTSFGKLSLDTACLQ